MATDAQVTSLRLRQPELPTSITDNVAKQYLDDAALEFDAFGIATTDTVYDKLLSLYALHLLTVNGLIQPPVTSESVKDVSASYAVGDMGTNDSMYYKEFRRTLRRRKYPYIILHNS